MFWIAGFILHIPLGFAFVFHSVPLYRLGIIPNLFWLACVWRSAPRSSHLFWALLARFYVVLNLAISVLVFV